MPYFDKVLVANRGEIAVRVLRALRELEIPSVIVHSDIDAGSVAVRMADQSVCVGPGPASQSYLRVPMVLAACEATGATAIHPGYGFLSENPEFAEICERAGIHFIGPSGPLIRLLGNKIRARETMERLGLPVLPAGGAVGDDADALVTADRLGYPVMVKAAGGGGGRGMRRVEAPGDLHGVLAAARAESRAAFGDGTLYIEKLLERPRHIEFQFAADRFGAAIHLIERECSLQRRNQKLMEECPSPVVTPALRAELGALVARAMGELGYVGVGTCEFLRDAEGTLYFLEVNPRLQVEHPITEMVTGVDLVALQLHLAAGEPLPMEQSQVHARGHAIECRIVAEHPETLRPTPGPVLHWSPPGGPGVRVDAGIEAGVEVPPEYDSLVAKIVVHAETRDRALRRMSRALAEMRLEGFEHSGRLHLRLLQNAAVRAGDLDTGLVARVLAAREAT